MTRQEQLIEYTTQDIVEFLCKSHCIDYDKAMQIFYSSQVFEKLQDVQTGLYKESSAYVYDLLKDELNFGRIVQAEI